MGRRVNGEYRSNLQFADDIALLRNSGDKLQSMITESNRQSRMVGLKINKEKKTKVMFNSVAREQLSEVTRKIRMGWSV